MRDLLLLQTMQKIGGLFFRRLNDELSEADRIALDEWIGQQDPVSQQFFEEVTDWEQVQAALQTMYQFDEAAAWEDIQKKIHVENVLAISASAEPLPLKRRNYKWLAVAAVLVPIIGAFFFFTITKRKTDSLNLPAAQRFKNDVLPGGAKAVLTLADGSKIVLDSVSNGELARQGATKVVKVNNGQLAYSAHPSSAQSVSYNTISTPRGGQYQVQLPDGSKVWLNAASSLRFPTDFAGKERSVELTGEAYFEIAHNTAHPFIVNANGTQVEVLGTHFNVMAYRDEEVVTSTLLEGLVQISRDDQKRLLHPGQQAQVGKGERILLLDNVDTDQVIAWKNGEFQFEKADLESVMRQLQRWYDIEVVYEGSPPSFHLVGSISRNVSLSNVLKLMELSGTHFKIEGKKLTVLQ